MVMLLIISVVYNAFNAHLVSIILLEISYCANRKIAQMMGLQGRLMGAQAAKKWENFKKKYKVIGINLSKCLVFW